MLFQILIFKKSLWCRSWEVGGKKFALLDFGGLKFAGNTRKICEQNLPKNVRQAAI